MRQTTAIPPPERSVYEAADSEGLRSVLDKLIEVTADAGNWKVRKRILLDIIAVLDAAAVAQAEPSDAPPEGSDAGPAEAAGETDADRTDAEQGEAEEEDEDEDEAIDPEAYFVETLPLYMGAILERLGEREIACVEQAAFYLLSAHREHQQAASDWLDSDYRHARDFKKFVNANRYYRGVLDRGLGRTDPFED